MQAMRIKVACFVLTCFVLTSLTSATSVSAQREDIVAPEQSTAVPANVALEEEEARALFEAGSLAFRMARYEEALARFERAYQLSSHPQLLYNIAVTADRLRRDEVAIDAFSRFLEAGPPDEQLRLQVEARLARLRGAVVSGATPDEVEGPRGPTPLDDDEIAVAPPAPMDAPEPATVTPATEAPTGQGAGPFVLLGTGGALAITGAVLLGFAVKASNTVTDAPDGTMWSSVEGDADRGPLLEGLGYASLSLGAAALVAAIVWLVAGDTDEEPAVTVRADGVQFRWGS